MKSNNKENALFAQSLRKKKSQEIALKIGSIVIYVCLHTENRVAYFSRLRFDLQDGKMKVVRLFSAPLQQQQQKKHEKLKKKNTLEATNKHTKKLVTYIQRAQRRRRQRQSREWNEESLNQIIPLATMHSQRKSIPLLSSTKARQS